MLGVNVYVSTSTIWTICLSVTDFLFFTSTGEHSGCLLPLTLLFLLPWMSLCVLCRYKGSVRPGPLPRSLAWTSSQSSQTLWWVLWSIQTWLEAPQSDSSRLVKPGHGQCWPAPKNQFLSRQLNLIFVDANLLSLLFCASCIRCMLIWLQAWTYKQLRTSAVCDPELCCLSSACVASIPSRTPSQRLPVDVPEQRYSYAIISTWIECSLQNADGYIMASLLVSVTSRAFEGCQQIYSGGAPVKLDTSPSPEQSIQ